MMETRVNNKVANNKTQLQRYRKIAAMCRECIGVIDELCNPLDAANRFINLVLQDTKEDSQTRQFLLESKEGIRIASLLLKKLGDHTHKLEGEISSLVLTQDSKNNNNE